MTKIKKIARRITAVLFPSRCAFCGSVMGEGRTICPACEKALPRITRELCENCGREKEFCTCNKHHYEFQRCVAPFYYESVAKRGVLRFKFSKKQDAAAVFAAYAADMIQREYANVAFDFVTAVPLSRAEMKKRGFNQSAEFAKAVSKELGLRYKNVLTKPFDTKPQRRCNASQRWGNVFGAFEAAEGLTGKTVLLADDIATTGATLNECARVLKHSGAQAIYCAVIACVKKNHSDTY